MSYHHRPSGLKTSMLARAFLGFAFTFIASVGCAPAIPTLAPTPTATLIPATPTFAPTPSPTLTSIFIPRNSTPTPNRAGMSTPIRFVPTATLEKRITPTGAKCAGDPTSVIHVAPGPETTGVNWNDAIVPMGDPCIKNIVVDPADENTWYVASFTQGVYITHDSGKTWERQLLGAIGGAHGDAIVLSPTDSNRVYIATNYNIYGYVFASTDKGRNWKQIGKFDQHLYSVHVDRDGTIYAGTNSAADQPNAGIQISHDQGATWQFSSFGKSLTSNMCWDIDTDPRDGTLYVSTEQADHPAPYHPPFFRSKDGGKTWKDVSADLVWHATRIQIDPRNGNVYAMLEGATAWISRDQGDTWSRLALGFQKGFNLLIDPNYPDRLFGTSKATYGSSVPGGLAVSLNGGANSYQAGLLGTDADWVSLNGKSTKVYVAVIGAGILVSNLPANMLPAATATPTPTR